MHWVGLILSLISVNAEAHILNFLWDAPAGTTVVNTYSLYGNGTKLSSIPAPTTQVTIRQIDDEIPLVFSATAVNESGESDKSNEVTTTLHPSIELKRDGSLTLKGKTGNTYDIEETSDLITWKYFLSITLPDESFTFPNKVEFSQAQRFFRVKKQGLTCLVGPVNQWMNQPIASQTGAFRIEFDATPAQDKNDGVIGLSKMAAGAYTDLAPIVRFNDQGVVDARNGAAYTAVNVIPFQGATKYHVIMDVDAGSKIYSASIDGKPLATNYAFRSDQAAVSSLGNLAAIGGLAGQSVCGIKLGSTPPPTGIASPAITSPVNGSTLPSGSAVTIGWNTVPGAVGYLIRMRDLQNTLPTPPPDPRNTWSGANILLYIDGYTQTSITIPASELIPGHSYDFWIHSMSSHYSSTDSTSYSPAADVGFSIGSTASAVMPLRIIPFQK